MDIWKSAKEIANKLLDTNSPIRLISHNDADGISSSAIMALSLLRENKKIHLSNVKGFNQDVIDTLKTESNLITVITDLGSGQIELLSDLDGDIIVVDHHLGHGTVPSHVYELNAHKIGINGTYEACAASLAFTISVSMNEKNWDLAPLAIAGIIGDRQNVGGLKGHNKEIVDSAIDNNSIKVVESLSLYGNDLRDALTYSIEPYILNYTGDSSKIDSVLKGLNIDGSTKISELTDTQISLLGSWIVTKLIEQGAAPEQFDSLFTNQYYSDRMEFDVATLSNLLNSCGNHDDTSTGIGVCFNDSKSIEKSKTYQSDSQKLILNSMNKAYDNLETLSSIQYFYTDISSIKGAVCGLSMCQFLDQSKPTLVLFKDKAKTFISSRGTQSLVSKGLNLAEAMRDASSNFNGQGGGHPIASGATIPIGSELEFLETVNQIISAQLST